VLWCALCSVRDPLTLFVAHCLEAQHPLQLQARLLEGGRCCCGCRDGVLRLLLL
jgi:hypothetical protein